MKKLSGMDIDGGEIFFFFMEGEMKREKEGMVALQVCS